MIEYESPFHVTHSKEVADKIMLIEDIVNEIASYYNESLIMSDLTFKSILAILDRNQLNNNEIYLNLIDQNLIPKSSNIEDLFDLATFNCIDENLNVLQHTKEDASESYVFSLETNSSKDIFDYVPKINFYYVTFIGDKITDMYEVNQLVTYKRKE